MSGSAGPTSSGQPASVPRRSYRAGLGWTADVLTTALLLLAGPVASVWVGVSPAAATSTPVWAQVFPALHPSAGQGSEMAYDPATSQVVLYSSGPGTTWTWDGTTWTQRATAAGSGLYASMAYDPHTNQLV